MSGDILFPICSWVQVIRGKWEKTKGEVIGATDRSRRVRFEVADEDGLEFQHFRVAMLVACIDPKESKKKKKQQEIKKEQVKEAPRKEKGSREVRALRTSPEMRNLADLLARLEMNPCEGSKVVSVLQQAYLQSRLELEVSLKKAEDIDEANER